MTKPHRNVLVNALDAVLHKDGFMRRQNTWYLVQPDTVAVVDLRKSTVSRDYYVDLGVSIRSINPALTPDMTDCHVTHELSLLAHESQRRVALLPPNPTSDEFTTGTIAHQLATDPLGPLQIHSSMLQSQQRSNSHVPTIFDALNLDIPIPDAERAVAITDALRNSGLPFLDHWKSIDDIRLAMQQRGDNASTAVRREVYELLGIPIPG